MPAPPMPAPMKRPTSTSTQPPSYTVSSSIGPISIPMMSRGGSSAVPPAVPPSAGLRNLSVNMSTFERAGSTNFDEFLAPPSSSEVAGAGGPPSKPKRQLSEKSNVPNEIKQKIKMDGTTEGSAVEGLSMSGKDLFKRAISGGDFDGKGEGDDDDDKDSVDDQEEIEHPRELS